MVHTKKELQMYWPNGHYGMESLVIVIVRTVARCLKCQITSGVSYSCTLIINLSVTNNAWRWTADHFSLQALVINKSL